VDTVKTVLAQTGARAGRLRLEITESIFQDNVSGSITKMDALREEGIRFSMDDFGTGYSSLSYLKRLPLAHLKIDKSFIDDIFEGSSDTAIVRTIIALADNLEIDVIAEGVETCEQMQWLLDNGCELFQGHLFSQPLHKDQLKAILENSPFLPAKELASSRS
jgi:EAL domain-containing protein (putative c-di-GMP-specific phosphodiesterase class I)